MASVRQSQYSQIATKALNADSASYAITASHALNGGGSPVTIKDEGSTLTTAVTSIDFVGAGVTATNSGNAVTVTIPGGGGGSIDTGSFVTTSSFNSYTSSINSFTSSYNTGSFTGSFIGTSSYALQALSASWAPPTIINTGSLLTTASVSLNTITFTKGDGSTFPITVDTGSGGGTIDTGSFLITASLSSSILVFEKGDTTTFNVPFNDFDFSLNFISAVSYSIILPYSYSIDTIDNPGALTVIISSSGAGYTTGSAITPFATTWVEVDTTGFINLNCTKLE